MRWRVFRARESSRRVQLEDGWLLAGACVVMGIHRKSGLFCVNVGPIFGDDGSVGQQRVRGKYHGEKLRQFFGEHWPQFVSWAERRGSNVRLCGNGARNAYQVMTGKPALIHLDKPLLPRGGAHSLVRHLVRKTMRWADPSMSIGGEWRELLPNQPGLADRVAKAELWAAYCQYYTHCAGDAAFHLSRQLESHFQRMKTASRGLVPRKGKIQSIPASLRLWCARHEGEVRPCNVACPELTHCGFCESVIDGIEDTESPKPIMLEAIWKDSLNPHRDECERQPEPAVSNLHHLLFGGTQATMGDNYLKPARIHAPPRFLWRTTGRAVASFDEASAEHGEALCEEEEDTDSADSPAPAETHSTESPFIGQPGSSLHRAATFAMDGNDDQENVPFAPDRNAYQEYGTLARDENGDQENVTLAVDGNELETIKIVLDGNEQEIRKIVLGDNDEETITLAFGDIVQKAVVFALDENGDPAGEGAAPSGRRRASKRAIKEPVFDTRRRATKKPAPQRAG